MNNRRHRTQLSVSRYWRRQHRSWSNFLLWHRVAWNRKAESPTSKSCTAMIAKIQRFGHFWTPPTLSRPLCGKLICKHIKHRLIAGKDETHVKKSTKGWRRKHGVHNPSPSTLWPAYGHYHLVYRLSCNFFLYQFFFFSSPTNESLLYTVCAMSCILH